MADPAASSPASVILVSIDTLRADHIGAYGYDRPTTPAIDTFAGDAVRFERCVAHASTTLASHAAMLTSLLPHQHGALVGKRSRLRDDVPTLAETLREHGYSTASFNGGVQLDAVFGLDRGFDVYESTHTNDVHAAVLAGPENRLEEVLAAARKWIAEAPRPFFLFLHSYEIHHPYTPLPEYRAHFPTGYEGPWPDHISVELLDELNKSGREVSAEERAHIIAAYDAELRSADAAFGRFVAWLREQGLYDDTLIALTSDHGEEFGEHGKMGWHSHTLYDELLSVPLIIRLPGSRNAGTVVADQVGGIDLAPTVLSALGIDAPKSYLGRDLGPLVEGQALDPVATVSVLDRQRRGPLFWSIRTDDWKLHRTRHKNLFALREDPGEHVDLAPQRQDMVNSLSEAALEQLHGRERAELVPISLRKDTADALRALGYIE